ncbi:OmpA family protein [Rhodospirillum rubrum]|uniref:OmpA/MotB n=2 Tax=Rhodospirillum rubrum TaxID=1085 RepID=Q2RP23_RHORT|nr:OmpA family protein [Rhodospirillum rubrum]ABC24122.1 OmpA/MotB [Rhodospirillum rubrum ATCC 11170]MBK5955835.1 OmpA family protein [Rhodospirillum rubrum]QXG80066.1 OmpA family protein [Rhodospirillum rubrum]CAB99313.1 porin-assoziated protein (PAP) [Rhodospirillum rubrum]HAP99769.1 OmpA family protein [Rhodospirillum rubrum]
MMHKVLISVAAAGLLTACADVWNYEEVATQSNAGTAFDAALQKDYVALAAHEANYGDWDDTAYYTNKAKLAAAGQTPAPTAMAERELGSYTGELTAARSALVTALGAGAPSSNPTVAAKAQTSFDCWAEEAEEDRQPEHIRECKQNFEIAMNALGGAPAPAVVSEGFKVFFALDSARLSPESEATLDRVSQAFLSGSPASVMVVGYADTSGPADYNILLSQRRAEAVARGLAQRGIASEVLTLEAYGEERLAVPTADGVVEQQNRRVEVVFGG